MNRRDIVIGLLIFLTLIGIVYWRRKGSVQQELKVPETLSSTESAIEEKFKVQIPDDADKAELKDVSGGDGSGIATRRKVGETFEVAMLVDLADPEPGKSYQGWLIKENGEGQEIVSVGQLRTAKGGWLLEYKSNKDLSNFKSVWITLEERLDASSEKRILEGSF